MIAGQRVVMAARATIGVRFRTQGRDPALGLDCVGVVAVALAGAGHAVTVPADYRVRRGVMPAGAVPAGCVPCAGDAPGDILLLRLSPAQLHLAVRTDGGIVHADAALRRVVERPGTPPWPIERAWRVSSKGE